MYSYDVDGQLTQIIDNLDPAKSLSINYDDLNRLVQVDQGIPGDVGLPVEDYAYDGEGNRLASHLSGLYSSNDHNQLLEDDQYTYAYDARGNRISRTAKATGAVETYSYDSQNRLVWYASDTTTASYAYDAMERRIAKTVDGATTAYVYDTSMDNTLALNDIIQEFGVNAGTTQLSRRWLHNLLTDEPLSFEIYAGAQTDPGQGNVYALYADHMGSISTVVDISSGSVAAEYAYDSFGQRVQFAGTLFQHYGYTARETDPESALIYFRARHYDPELGQFISSDSWGFAANTLNLYAYVDNNVFKYSDPSGHAQALPGGPSTSGMVTLASATTAAAVNALSSTYQGLTNGPLDAIMQGLFMASSNMSGDDEAAGEEGGGGGGGQCDPDPKRWEAFKIAFIRSLEALATVFTLHGNLTDIPPNVDDFPTNHITDRASQARYQRWLDRQKQLNDTYASGRSPDDDEC